MKKGRRREFSDNNNAYITVRVAKAREGSGFMWIKWEHKTRMKGGGNYIKEAMFPLCLS